MTVIQKINLPYSYLRGLAGAVKCMDWGCVHAHAVTTKVCATTCDICEQVPLGHDWGDAQYSDGGDAARVQAPVLDEVYKGGGGEPHIQAPAEVGNSHIRASADVGDAAGDCQYDHNWVLVGHAHKDNTDVMVVVGREGERVQDQGRAGKAFHVQVNDDKEGEVHHVIIF